MPNRRTESRRGVLRPGRVGTLLIACVPLGLAIGACAKSEGIVVDPNTTPVGGGGAAPDLTGRCGDGGIACGEGCCPSGNTCTAAGTCVPAAACTSNDDCGSDSVCGGGTCRSWSVYPAAMAYDLSCRNAVSLPSLRPEVQCNWPGETAPTEFPNSVQVIGTPMVADFDFDDDPATIEPSIVFISYEGSFAEVAGVIRVIDGRTCRLQATIPGRFPFTPEVSVALGDVNGDGRPDIVAADEEVMGVATRSGVAVFSPLVGSPAFTEIGRQRSSVTSIIKGLSIHDITDDERPEILTDTGIYFVDSALGLVELENVSGSFLEPPIVRDIDGDRIAELITSQGISSWDIENQRVIPKTVGNIPVWNPSQNLDSAFVGMADFGEFPTTMPGGGDSIEMVVVGFAGQLWVTRVDGGVLQAVNSQGDAGGPPVIADFDGDGRMEFASPGRDKITVFDLDCLDDAVGDASNCRGTPNRNGVLWQVSGLQGATSGASVFDFDGDRRAEVVYADQCFMRVFDGVTGDVLFSVPRSSTTRWEYPVIADVDGDGHTEIVTPSNDNDATVNCPATDRVNTKYTSNFMPTHGVTVWADAEKRWAGSRPIWNQHSYAVTNVNDNGTVPRMTEVISQWNSPVQNPNTFRQNVQGATGVSLDLPDLTTAGQAEFTCFQRGGIAEITVKLCNRGLFDLPADKATVAMVEEGTRNVVCPTQAASRTLRAGQCEDLTCEVPVPTSSSDFNIAILGDPNTALEECHEGNNTSVISNVFCPGGVD